MTPERWDRIGTIFGEAAELAEPARSAYLDRACESEPDLRAEVVELLERHDSSGAFVDAPVVSPAWQRPGGSRTFHTGQLLGSRFRIERFLGEGGMGEVYAAFDTELGTRVALKTMHPHLAANEKFAERFRREIQLARQVTHPNVCRIFDAGRHGGVLYLTMELMEGETLAQRIRRGALDTATALPVIRQICEGLAAAHAAGVVHRDLKPANVILLEGRAVITDFGLARIAETGGGEQATQSAGVAIGTPAYMAPEQMEGASSGPPADIYALGVVIYETVTGHRPFGDDSSPLAMAVRKAKDQPTPPRQWTEVPALWERVILKCLAAKPEERFESALAVAEALEGTRRFRGRGRSRRSWIAAAAACLCIAAGWGASVAYRSRLSPPAAVESWYREGVHALHDGNPATAQRALARVTQLAPGWAAGHARLAQAYKELDQSDSARQEILEALRVQAFLDPGADLVKAVQSQVSLDFPAAAKAFRGVAARQSGADRLDAMLDHARVLEQGDKPAEAVTVLEEILAANAEAPAANLMRATLGIRLSDRPEKIRPHFDRAIAGFRALNRIEALSQGQLELSKWLFRQKEAGAARDLATRSLESARAAQSPYAEAQALFQLARIADTVADREAAEASLAQGREIARRERFGELEVQGFVDLGIQFYTQKKIEMALTEFQNGVAEAERVRSPRGRARALHWSGVALAQMGKTGDAIARFKQAAELHAASGFVREAMRTRLGEVAALTRAGDYARAVAMAEDVRRQVGALGDVEHAPPLL